MSTFAAGKTPVFGDRFTRVRRPAGFSGHMKTISFDAIPNQILGVSPIPITARATSGLSISFTSNIPAVCKTAEERDTGGRWDLLNHSEPGWQWHL